VAGALPILQPLAGPDADPSRVVSSPDVWGPKLQALRALFATRERWVVAFSGGVDSAFVLAVAVQELGDRVTALTAVSPTLPDEEREGCIALARQLGAAHVLVESDEMGVEGFFTNPTNRCYFCKSELYRVAWDEAEKLAIGTVADGVNVDDLGDHRPGLVAADERGIVHPLVEVGMSKADVRGAALGIDLPVWDKPAFACLSSRFPYGTWITPERLQMVGSVERLLNELGFRQYRVRFHDELVRIEVRAADLPRLVSEPVRSTVVQACKDAGFTYVTIDLQGFRSGAMNEVLPD
jgi:uncharacterized protein